MQEKRVRSLGPEDSLKKEMATHSSILAWEMPYSGAQWGYSPWGHKRVRRDLATKQQLNEYIYVYRNTPNMYMNIYVHMYAYIYKDEYMCR